MIKETATTILTRELNRRLIIKSVVDDLVGKEKGKSRVTLDANGDGTLPNPFPYDPLSGYSREQWQSFTCYIKARKNTAICYEVGLGGLPCRFARDLQQLSAEMAVDTLMPLSSIDQEDRKALTKDAKAPDFETGIRQSMSDAIERMHSIFMREFWRKGSKGQRFAFSQRGWTEQMARDFELGYHDSGTILKEAEANGISKHMLADYGYLTKMEHQAGDGEDNYEFFEKYQNRISYPVRNASGQLTAFSFRDTGANEERWKKQHTVEVGQGKKYGQKCLYMPSDLTIEPNELQMFGIDLAAKEISNSQRSMYIVEGQPDVMRMRELGVRNVVGIMTALINEKKLRILADLGVNQLIFVPDVDRFDADKEPYGAGFTACLQNIESAMRIPITHRNEPANIETQVIEILSDSNGNAKADVDSQFRHGATEDAGEEQTKQLSPREVWAALRPKSGVSWWSEMASKAIGMGSAQDKVDWQKRLATMLADVASKDVRDVLLVEAIKAGKNLTKTQVSTYLKEVLGERNKKKFSKEQTFKGDLSLYGFHETASANSAGHIYVSNSNENPFTDFVIDPHYFVKNLQQGSTWICEFICENGNREVIPLSDEDVTAVAKFKRMAARASMSFEGKDPELAMLFRFIKSNCQSVQMISRMGWQPSLNVWCWGNGVYENGEFVSCNKFGVAKISRDRHVYIPAAREVGELEEDTDQYQFEHDFSFEDDNRGNLNKVERPKLADVFYMAHFLWEDNGIIIIMWLVGAMFRDVVVQYGEHYPILAGYGPKGSGKSASSEFMTSFFSRTDSLRKTLSSSKASLDSMVQASSNAVVHWDEYNDAIGRDVDKLEMIKGFWDGVTRSKMNANTNFKSAISTRVKSALILTGQVMPNHDASMIRRFCLCEYYDNKERFNDPTNKTCFEVMTSWKRMGLKHLTHELLNYHADMEQNYKRFYDEVRDEINSALRSYSNIVPSIADNFINILAVMKTLSREAWWPFSYDEARDLCIRRILWQSNMSEAKDERAAFWNTLQRAVNRNDVINGVHFKIKPSSKVSCQERGDLQESIKSGCRRVLFLRYDDVYPILRQYARNDDDLSRKLMDASTMFHYIEKQGCFGKSTKETFFNVDQQNHLLRNEKNEFQPAKRQPSYAFNYDKLQELYPDLNLEDAPNIASIEEDSQPAAQEQAPSPAPQQYEIQTPEGDPF